MTPPKRVKLGLTFGSNVVDQILLRHLSQFGTGTGSELKRLAYLALSVGHGNIHGFATMSAPAVNPLGSFGSAHEAHVSSAPEMREPGVKSKKVKLVGAPPVANPVEPVQDAPVLVEEESIEELVVLTKIGEDVKVFDDGRFEIGGGGDPPVTRDNVEMNF